ncbi:hypothetical protein [Paractinoplanes toevensis]|uniref:Uncharacterized protein n=1 Tax=Paractinoplanes toevensis TaxID=571911 RepID=A0A919WDF4_9ACTN|nr:hypothetical protein [Actinoplanes toevensis]GIM98227.1 hypothetical protein Ato02nite_100200 [Actinoplanes toevensis]
MAADDLVQIITALCAGGGLWLAIREIAKRWGETKRERIRQDAETERLTITHRYAVAGAPEHRSTGAPEPAGRAVQPGTRFSCAVAGRMTGRALSTANLEPSRHDVTPP